jgi:hypothetical protein
VQLIARLGDRAYRGCVEARHGRRIALLALALCLACAPSAAASGQKAIWGPTHDLAGNSAFPIYRDLGASIFEMGLRWDRVAPTRPAHPRDPSDPAYRWPDDVQFAVDQAAASRMSVLLLVSGAPRWANGGHRWQWAPKRPSAYADFIEAASRRYPSVRFWQIWGEPTRRDNFLPLTPALNKPLRVKLTRRQAAAPRRYARLLDAAYGAVKRVDKRDLVVGGDSYTLGDILPLDWIRALRLPNGRPPRMDLYGHNPFTIRRPNLSDPMYQRGVGYGDFSDLDIVSRWVNRYLRRGHRLRLFLGEFTVPTDHLSPGWNVWVTPEVQADWLGAALNEMRGWSGIYAFGWITLYDDPPNAAGNEMHGGLIDSSGRSKPSYAAYRRG